MKPVKYKPTTSVYIASAGIFCLFIALLFIWPSAIKINAESLLTLVAPDGLLPEDLSIIQKRVHLASNFLTIGIFAYILLLNICIAFARPLEEVPLKIGKFLFFLFTSVAAFFAVFTIGLTISTRIAPEDLDNAKSISDTVTKALIVAFLAITVIARPQSEKSITRKETRTILTSGALSVIILAVIGILAALIHLSNN